MKYLYGLLAFNGLVVLGLWLRAELYGTEPKKRRFTFSDEELHKLGLR